MKKRIRLCAAVMALTLLLGACSKTTESGKEEVRYTIGTASSSGVHYSVGTLIADAINSNSDYLRLFPQITGGGEENGRSVQEGEYEFGFWAVDSIVMAYNGEGEAYLPDLRGVMTVQCNAAQYITRIDSGIETWEDCRGKRIGIGTTSTIGEMMTRAILAHYGIDWDTDLARTEILGNDEAREKLQDGDLDMIYIAGGYPMAGVVELMSTGDYRIMSTPKEDLETIFTANYVDYSFDSYSAYTIGAGTYPNQDYDVVVPGGRLLIFTRDDIPEDDVYEFLRIVYEQWDTIKEGHLALRDLDWNEFPKTGIPLHPGAERLYEEIGLL